MTVDAGLPGFTHVAVCHRSTRELIETLIPVLGDWLGMNESVFGADSDRIRWSDTRRWHPHPTRRLRAIQELVDAEERQGAAQLRFVGECAFPAGPPELVVEWGKFASERRGRHLSPSRRRMPVAANPQTSAASPPTSRSWLSTTDSETSQTPGEQRPDEDLRPPTGARVHTRPGCPLGLRHHHLFPDRPLHAAARSDHGCRQ